MRRCVSSSPRPISRCWVIRTSCNWPWVAESDDIDSLRAIDICTDHVVTLEASSGVDDAVKLMTEKAIRRIPVVENEMPIGIVTIGDLAAQREPASALGMISQAAPNN